MKIKLIAALSSEAEKILSPVLQNDYDVMIVRCGIDAIHQKNIFQPEVILIDATLNDVPAPLVARALTLDEYSCQLPLLFISSNPSSELKLECYNSGAVDFLSLDSDAKEILYKIEMAVHFQRKNLENENLAKTATMVAQTAISNASELGLLIGSVADLAYCTNVDSLANCVMDTCRIFDLSICLQVRLFDKITNYSHTERMPPLILLLLDDGVDAQRLVEFESRLIVNFPKISILVKNMPVNDPGKMGRFRDHLVILAKCADSKVGDIKTAITAKELRQATVSDVMITTERELKNVDQVFENNQQEANILVNELVVNLEEEVTRMVLDEGEQESLLAVVENSRFRLVELFDSYNGIHHCMRNLSGKLQKFVRED